MKYLKFFLCALALCAFVGCSSDKTVPTLPSNAGDDMTSFTASMRVDGPGGHSFYGFGAVSCLHAASNIISNIVDNVAKDVPTAVVNINNLVSGNSVNAIANVANFSVEVTAKAADVDKIKAIIQKSVDDGLATENEFRGKTGVVTAGAKQYVRISDAGIVYK